MTCNITSTPLIPEPLPLYTRDPDTVSVHSTAPSYVSEAPTYHSRRQSIPSNGSSGAAQSTNASSSTTGTSPRQGLPSPRYAPGFQARGSGSPSSFNFHNYNIGNWSSVNTSHASRQYHAVARRRASQAANTTAILNSLSAVPPSTTATSSPNASSAAVNNYPANTAPISPLEDPYLVGEEAAGRARAQRVYREMCMKGEEAVKYESKAWGFMLSQMGDWDDREKSWTKFREQVGRTKLLGRRIGLR